MRHDATTDEFADGAFAVVTGARAKSAALALRHARAMKAVLLAAKAWARAREASSDEFRYADAERRLYAAQARLAKIEKKVSRG